MRGAAAVLNPVSKWEEVTEVEGITLYDIHRPKRAQVEEDGQRNLPQSLINSELTCPICLSIMSNTHIVMECLHRFCGACIEKCLRVGKHECPSCRQRVPSRRSLRPDPNFDSLIAKLYSQEHIRAAEVAMDAKAITEHKRKYQEQVQKIQQDARQLQKQRKVIAAPRERSSASHAASASAPAPAPTTPQIPPVSRTIGQEAKRQRPHIMTEAFGPSGAAVGPPKVRVTMVPFADLSHPGWNALATLTRPHIRAPTETSVAVLKKYLTKVLPDCPPVDNLELLTLYRERYVILDDMLDLRTIVFNFWERKGQLLLFYRAVQTYTGGDANWQDRKPAASHSTTTAATNIPLSVS